jgi:hypothetical protein
MGEMRRDCRECGGEQLFDQPHHDAGRCPDLPDGDCPEWACTVCGAALFTGIAALTSPAASVDRWPAQVA